MSLDANDLLMFARVVEAGSFSRAAERLNCPKSTVSRRVSALEKRFGEKLLLRTTRKLALTEFGHGVLDHARGVAAEVDEALALALHRQARPSGRLRVSMPGDFAVLALAPMLAAFVAAHPQIDLELDLSPRRVDLIGENVDLAVRMGELPDDAALAARRIGRFGTGLYASPDYLRRHGEPRLPAALLDAQALMLLSRHDEPQPWQLTRGEGAAAQTWRGLPPRRTRANSPELLMRLAIEGAGIALATDLFAQAPMGAGTLVRVLPEWCLPPADAWAVFPGRRLMPARTRVFLDALVQALAQCPAAQA